MWAEFVAAAAFVAYSAYVIALGVAYRNLDRHGGIYHYLLGLFLLIGALAFASGGWMLRGTKPSGWLGQLFPVVVTSWVLWDVLSHPLAR
jgi:uncharacterized membrane protein YfcA